jgi:glycosyltransferase involved in cell wall biosynthesis
MVPCHNEQKSLPILCSKLENVLNRELKRDWEVILVDDVSTDDTWSIMEEFHQKDKNFRVIRLKHRGGQTGCYQAAFDIFKGQFILRMDGDLQDNPDDLPLFLDKMRKSHDVIVGIREGRKHSRLHRFASLMYHSLALLIFGVQFREPSSSYVAFKAHLVKNLRLYPNDHRYLVTIAEIRGIKKPGEVITQHGERVGGKSKYKLYKKILFGFPEFILFSLRAKLGYYDYKR